MIYYSDQEITIRSLQPEDADTIAAEEVAQGWIMPVHKNIISACKTKRTARQSPLPPTTVDRLPAISTYISGRNRELLPIRESRKSSILGYWKNTAAAASAVN